MPKIAYLGERVELHRSRSADPGPTPEPVPLGHVIPTLRVSDPNGEPIVITATVPDYGSESEPLREIHLFAVPADAPGETAEHLIENPANYVRAGTDVTNIKASSVDLSLAGVPDGIWAIQSVLIAGSD